MDGTPQDLRTLELGQVVATPAILQELDAAEIAGALQRHASGDDGVLDQEDKEANRLARAEGHRVLSAYLTEQGQKFWIITEWDRSATTILFPREY
jgi:hypothetical protein